MSLSLYFTRVLVCNGFEIKNVKPVLSHGTGGVPQGSPCLSSPRSHLVWQNPVSSLRGRRFCPARNSVHNMPGSRTKSFNTKLLEDKNRKNKSAPNNSPHKSQPGKMPTKLNILEHMFFNIKNPNFRNVKTKNRKGQTEINARELIELGKEIEVKVKDNHLK